MSQTLEQFTLQDIEKLAHLARLELSSQEAERYTKELGAILDYVAQLKQIPIKTKTSVEISPVELRPDSVSTWPKASELIGLAPEQSGGLVRVPPVFKERG